MILSSPLALAIANSPDGLWGITQNYHSTQTQNFSTQSFDQNIQQKSAQVSPDIQLELEANLSAMLEVLNEAPLLSQKQTGAQGVIIYLPLADGSFSRFEVFNNPIIKASKKNQANIQTYKAFGLDKKNLVAHLDLSARGFHAMIRGNGHSFFIDPELQNKNGSLTHYGLLKTQVAQFSCGAIENPSDFNSTDFFAKTAARSSGSILRTYDLAVVATPSYSGVFTDLENPNKADVFSAIVTAINRVNLVFNQDLAIELHLLEEHDLIFTDSAAENYPFENNINQDLSKITNVINNTIGSANYDVGHMLTKSQGGVAYIKSVCNNTIKGAGATGSTNNAHLQSEYFYIDYIAHELGHQFGANHSFNSNSVRCNTRNAATAVEPGSGSTIMGYAGVCEDGQDLQSNSDAYFHTTSINEILNHVESQSCHTSTGSLGAAHDNPPEFLNYTSNHSIPSHTAFYLEAEATDIDGGNIFYSWEQTDVGTATKNLTEMHTDFGSNPLFRSLMSNANQGKRFFPAFNTVIQGTTPIGEAYPTKQRQLNFTVTARSQPYGSNTATVKINVTKTDEGFTLLHPAADAIYPANQAIDLYWNTANTENNPVSCKKIDIYYSDSNSPNRDDYVLLEANIENDGKHTLSEFSANTNARLLIECSDNIFYSAGSGKFTLSSDNTDYFSVTSNKSALTEGNSGEKTVSFTITRTGNLSQANSIDFQFTGYGNHSADSSDYTAIPDFSGTLNFEAGQNSHSLEVVIIGDTMIEQNESFQLVISTPQSGHISKGFASVMILNDDYPPITDETNSTKKTKSSGGGGSMFYLLALLFFAALKRKTVLLLCIGIFISACAPQQEKPEALHPQAQKLVWVEHANAKQEVEKHFRLHGKESKFLGFSLRGHIQVPGLVEETLEQALKQGYTLQEGMGDVIFSERHMYLREQFFIYASEYNQLLAEKLFGN